MNRAPFHAPSDLQTSLRVWRLLSSYQAILLESPHPLMADHCRVLAGSGHQGQDLADGDVLESGTPLRWKCARPFSWFGCRSISLMQMVRIVRELSSALFREVLWSQMMDYTRTNAVIIQPLGSNLSDRTLSERCMIALETRNYRI